MINLKQSYFICLLYIQIILENNSLLYHLYPVLGFSGHLLVLQEKNPGFDGLFIYQVQSSKDLS